MQDTRCRMQRNKNYKKIPGLRSHQNLNIMYYVTILTNQQSTGGRRKFYRLVHGPHEISVPSKRANTDI